MALRCAWNIYKTSLTFLSSLVLSYSMWGLFEFDVQTTLYTLVYIMSYILFFRAWYFLVTVAVRLLCTMWWYRCNLSCYYYYLQHCDIVTGSMYELNKTAGETA